MKDAPTTSEHAEPDSRFEDALQTVDTLLVHSRDILSAMTAGDIPRLSQLLMKRGQLIEHLQLIDLGAFDAPKRSRLQEGMDAVGELEPDIQEGLKALGDKLGSALKSNREWRVAIGQYKQSISGESTRMDEA